VSTEAERHVLVVANETLTGDELLEAVKRRAAQGPVRVHVIAPVNEPAAGYVVYENSRRAAAGRRLERALKQLRDADIPALGDVIDENPLDAVKDTLAQEPVDELIVSTHPETKSGWLRRNLLDEIRRAAGERPVEHVVAGERVGPANVLVVANETVLGVPLLERVRARAAEEPASFLIVCPQSDPSGAHHPEAERRLRQALAELRADGIEAHGQIAHPDPYTAARQAVHDERIDEIIVSTFPGERSRWLRRDLVGRLRSDTKLPVEHVVVDPAQIEVTV
jgi:hypothetical protein